jgi:hypothetical protein
MKNLRFGSYPWLCLCPLFFILMLSCRAMHPQKKEAITALSGPRSNATTYWELEVRLLPTHFDFGANVANLGFILSPYDVREDGQCGTEAGGRIVVSYRLCDSIKLAAAENALLSSGAVTGIRITKITQ